MAELTAAAAIRLLFFLGLPWLTAYAFFRLVLPVKQAGGTALQVGLALIFGPLLAAPALKIADLTGWSLEAPFALLGLAIVAACCLTAAAVIGALSAPPRLPNGGAQTLPWPSPRLQKIVAGILLALIALRLLSLLPDLLLRPVFPWDAWKTWAWKARVWFEMGELVQFAHAREWLSAPADQFVIDGVNHPDMISLVILWSAVGLGYWDDSLLGLPWLMCGIGIALTVFGALRLADVPALIALAAVYVLLSLPMLATHIVLWGYADLWMAGTFAALTAGLLLWTRRPDWRFLLLVALAAAMMVLTKDTGSYWVPVIVAVLAGLALPNRWLLAAVGLAGVAAALLYVIGFDPVSMLTGGRFRLDTQPVGAALAGMARHLFVWLDWHLLGYLLPLILLAALLQANHSREVRALLILVAFSLAALLAGFTLTRAAQYAMIGTLFSRMFMQITPAIAMLAALAAWQSIQSRAVRRKP